jgi:hypothetical protein
MANIRISEAARHAMLSALFDRVTRLGPGTLCIYSGEQPATADTLLGDDARELASLSVPPPGHVPVGGELRLSVTDQVARMDGVPTFARAKDAAGVPVFDGDVRSDGRGFINFTPADFEVGGPVRIEEFVIFIPEDIQFEQE